MLMIIQMLFEEVDIRKSLCLWVTLWLTITTQSHIRVNFDSGSEHSLLGGFLLNREFCIEH